MQANWREIAKAFNESQNYVLATIIETRGATYQKAGAMMLINEQGNCYGLLSGGCLEADISLHAKQVLLDEKSTIIRYDLSNDADLLWGLGLGCDGAIDILLQPLLTTNNHLDFGSLLSSIKLIKSGYYLQNIPLYTLVSNHQTESLNSFKSSANFVLLEHFDYSNLVNDSRSIGELATESNNKEQYSFVTPINPPINLLICGAGPDVVPVANFAEQMGWQVTLWDHRKSHLQESLFNRFQRRCVRPKDTDVVDYQNFNAVIVMTHNLTKDAEYLTKLNATPTTKLCYIGLLGPKTRRDKLLSLCGIDLTQNQQRIFGPIGLNLGGRGAEAIALSVISEIQQHFYAQISAVDIQNQSLICSMNDPVIKEYQRRLIGSHKTKSLLNG